MNLERVDIDTYAHVIHEYEDFDRIGGVVEGLDELLTWHGYNLGH